MFFLEQEQGGGAKSASASLCVGALLGSLAHMEWTLEKKWYFRGRGGI